MRVALTRRACIAAVSSSFCRAGEYFPPQSLGARAKCYSEHLSAFREPSLWEASARFPDARVLRFLWLRSFDHPISIRLTIDPDGTGTLAAKELNGAGGCHPGRIVRNRTSRLTLLQVNYIKNQFRLLLPLMVRHAKAGEAAGTDGASWIFEYLDHGSYRLLDVWSPMGDHPGRSLGLALLKLSGLTVESDDIY